MTIWKTKPFNKLGIEELYALLKLRQEVFVVEQDCPYLDADGKDQNSLHVLGYIDNELAAYARIVEPGISYAEAAIGRVITKATHRNLGLGKDLMTQTHQSVEQVYGKIPIRLSAQSHLKRFYTELGYEPTGKEYLEDGIPHMEMLKEN